ncbi:peter Pan-like protein [Rutidosis leptorrhynchoides]|uniref:peter Pan-like protein n=1 Tax=Rutidosis leptorrhynchoides TaxID=125765 RepID=UPI003A9A43FC
MALILLILLHMCLLRLVAPQQNVDPVTGDNIPRSFIFSRLKLPGSLKQLQADLRKMMLPYTALNLKEKKRNNLRDFLNVAGPMRVTHFLMLSKIGNSPYLRVARTPQGPTLRLKFKTTYLKFYFIAYLQITNFIGFIQIVLSGFGIGEQHLKAGYGSESEGDDVAATVNLASDLGKINKACRKSAVKLQEIGPNMTIQLIKIEDALCAGTVFFSEQRNFLLA